MTESYGAKGELVRREFFPDQPSHLVIQYDAFQVGSGRNLPQKIVLTWQDGDIRMVIRLVEWELVRDVSDELWRR